jgi:hypothetical protein
MNDFEYKEKLEALLRLMITEVDKSAAVREEEAKRRKAQRERNALAQQQKILLRQQKCSYLKGSHKRRSGLLADSKKLWKEWLSDKSRWPNLRVEKVDMAKDYNISDHTFIDGSRIIKCIRCGKTWAEGDESWSKALEMAASTTNGRTASERPGVIVRLSSGELEHFKNLEEVKIKYPNATMGGKSL